MLYKQIKFIHGREAHVEKYVNKFLKELAQHREREL